jgi:hypothetical protein
MDHTISSKPVEGARSEAPEAESVAMRLYRTMLESWVRADSPRLASAALEGARMLAEANPNDAIESMLMQQAVWLHARMGHLSHFATIQTKHRPMKMMHEAADRVAGACRRHLMALAEYRDPKRRRFTAVKQANFAQQIVVGPRRKRGRPRKNEQIEGLCDGGGDFSRAAAEKISFVAKGAGGASPEHLAEEAVDSEFRPIERIG